MKQKKVQVLYKEAMAIYRMYMHGGRDNERKTRQRNNIMAYYEGNGLEKHGRIDHMFKCRTCTRKAIAKHRDKPQFSELQNEKKWQKSLLFLRCIVLTVPNQKF